jgi:hypothetical protein
MKPGGKRQPLSESQARILAHWWGCGYERQDARRAEAGGASHRVAINAPLNEGCELPRPGLAVAFLEEARALERQRHFDNHAHALDWDW